MLLTQIWVVKKNSFGFFHNIIHKNLNKHFGQPNSSFIISTFLYILIYQWPVFSSFFCFAVVVVVQLLSRFWLFATPWTVAHQASLSITNTQSLLQLMSMESVVPYNHLILCHPLLLLPSIFPRVRVFSNESASHIRWTKYWASFLLMNIQNWFPLGLTGLISLHSKGLSKSSPRPQFKTINSLALSLLYGTTLTFIHDYWKNHRFD